MGWDICINRKRYRHRVAAAAHMYDIFCTCEFEGTQKLAKMLLNRNQLLAIGRLDEMHANLVVCRQPLAGVVKERLHCTVGLDL